MPSNTFAPVADLAKIDLAVGISGRSLKLSITNNATYSFSRASTLLDPAIEVAVDYCQARNLALKLFVGPHIGEKNMETGIIAAVQRLGHRCEVEGAPLPRLSQTARLNELLAWDGLYETGDVPQPAHLAELQKLISGVRDGIVRNQYGPTNNYGSLSEAGVSPAPRPLKERDIIEFSPDTERAKLSWKDFSPADRAQKPTYLLDEVLTARFRDRPSRENFRFTLDVSSAEQFGQTACQVLRNLNRNLSKLGIELIIEDSPKGVVRDALTRRNIDWEFQLTDSSSR